MSITEEHRRNLFNGLEEAIGTEEANHLMQLLPATPASELVTRTDMHAFGTELRGEVRTEIAALRNEMADLIGSLNRLVIAGMAGNAIAVVTALAV